jgi:hypothetical protein
MFGSLYDDVKEKNWLRKFNRTRYKNPRQRMSHVTKIKKLPNMVAKGFVWFF